MYRYLLIILKQSVVGDLYSRVSVRFIGEKAHFGERNEVAMGEIENRVLKTTDCHVNIAVSYGGQDEIVRATNLAIEDGHKRVSKSIIANYLYTAGIPDPDLVVRTSGVQRISNFLTWQSVYSEFIFYEKFWPEMTSDDIGILLAAYYQRERRFGR
jgi:undecaprenyl diphosphate synthase